MKRLSKYAALFLIGAVIYFEIELNYRYFAGTLPVHWSMPILGGICFILIGGLNEWLPWDMPLPLQSFIGSVVATVAEFISGCIVNIWMGWDVWDYSNIPFNLLGQICLPFCLAWILVATVAIILDDYLRYWLYGEEKPLYKLI